MHLGYFGSLSPYKENKTKKYELLIPPLQHCRGICVIQRETVRQYLRYSPGRTPKHWLNNLCGGIRQTARAWDLRLQWTTWPFLSWKINRSDIEHMSLYIEYIFSSQQGTLLLLLLVFGDFILFEVKPQPLLLKHSYSITSDSPLESFHGRFSFKRNILVGFVH